MKNDKVLVSRETVLSATAALLLAHPPGSARAAKLKETVDALHAEVARSPSGLVGDESAMLHLVLTEGLPLEREGKFRMFGFQELGWFDSPLQAVRAAAREQAGKSGLVV